jgi:c(7)-type cytochrome triheme protein
LRALFVLALAVGAPATLAFGAAFPATLRIPRRASSNATTMPAAMFSHRSHGAFGCFACHPSVFPQAPLAFTHEDMRGGRFCGSCHDGAHAFAVGAAACGGCHVAAR